MAMRALPRMAMQRSEAMQAIRRILISAGLILFQASCWLLILFAAQPVQAASPAAHLEPPPHTADSSYNDGGISLSLEEAAKLPLDDQPILSGHEAVINAYERRGIATAQLPDPRPSRRPQDRPVACRKCIDPR